MYEILKWKPVYCTTRYSSSCQLQSRVVFMQFVYWMAGIFIFISTFSVRKEKEKNNQNVFSEYNGSSSCKKLYNITEKLLKKIHTFLFHFSITGWEKRRKKNSRYLNVKQTKWKKNNEKKLKWNEEIRSKNVVEKKTRAVNQIFHFTYNFCNTWRARGEKMRQINERKADKSNEWKKKKTNPNLVWVK